MRAGPYTTALLPFVYLLTTLIVAGLLAYPLYLATDGAVSLRALVSRGSLALLLLSLPWLVARLGLGRRELGLPDRAASWIKGLASGLLAGVLVMALLVALEMALGLRVAIWPAGRFAAALPEASGKPLLVGALVGVVEELLFRGVLLGALAKHRGAVYAIAVSAFYYAAPHFYRSILQPPVESLGWSSGLAVVWDGFVHLADWNRLDSFVALYCAGLLLACLRLLAGTGLALCIGVHTGWVYTLRTTLALTDLAPASRWGFLVGDYDHIIGWLAAAWLALLTLPLLWALHRRRRP